jgi:tripartite-type tricarboxylate transporter receptor subunit TctC
MVASHQGRRHQAGVTTHPSQVFHNVPITLMLMEAKSTRGDTAMKLQRRRFLHLAAGAAMLPALPRIARAQAYPTRPMTMVVPFAAGSGSDVLARVLGPRLSEILGQQVIVENVGGAGGMIGSARVAKAAPDGYQFVLGSTSTHAQNQSIFKNPLYNGATDFAPVALAVDLPQVFIARSNLPVSTLAQFKDYARPNQGRMQFGSAGVGSGSHLACALLNSALGLNVTHVPYRSSAQAMQDLIAGQMDYFCPLLSAAISQLESKTIKPIAILTHDRSPILPNLPSAHEQGMTDFAADSWQAFFLPKGTPPAIVKKLHDAVVEVLNTRSVQDRLTEVGATVVAPERRSPEYLQQFVLAEIDKWAAVIKANGISAD